MPFAKQGDNEHKANKPSTRASSGVMVAHLTATLYFFVASAESIVTWSSVWSRQGRPRSKYFSSTSTFVRMSCTNELCEPTLAQRKGNNQELHEPSLWWIPKWFESSHLHPSQPLAGPPWCAVWHLKHVHKNVFLCCLQPKRWTVSYDIVRNTRNVVGDDTGLLKLLHLFRWPCRSTGLMRYYLWLIYLVVNLMRFWWI